MALEGIKTDLALAKLLDVKPNTISTWRKRQTIPYDVLFRFCEDHNYDIGWLITGRITSKYIDVDGERVLVSAAEPGLYKQDEDFNEMVTEYNAATDTSLSPHPDVDISLMKDVIEGVEEVFQKRKLHLPPKKKAELIGLIYEEILENESKKTSIPSRVLKLIKLAS